MCNSAPKPITATPGQRPNIRPFGMTGTPTYQGRFGANAGSAFNQPQRQAAPVQARQANPIQNYGYSPAQAYQGLGGANMYTGAYTPQGYQQPAAQPAAQPAVQAAAPTAPPPQVRTQIVTGGADMYRDASAAEMNKQGKLKAQYQNGVWADPTPAPLPSAQSGVVQPKTPPKDAQLSPTQLAARQKSRLLARQLRNTG